MGWMYRLLEKINTEQTIYVCPQGIFPNGTPKCKSLDYCKIYFFKCSLKCVSPLQYMSFPKKLTGLEGHICPSLVRNGKDIYVPLLWRHGGVIVISFRVSWTWWCKKNYYIVVRGTWALDVSWIMEENWPLWQINDWFN